ncbi:FliJ protein [Alicyclobacillus hesperidum]|uniref:Flagellar FliJ protein n=1 Tax=Alicyclobacillus hesperidum TaxID=89784 RepID=A0A1H2SFT1_9BACL|nr:flagellar FliJ family protein [Alicyclobacillus hesperidum]SDW30553.1 FliJ protein [Alicyclobacillus hesperidum]
MSDFRRFAHRYRKLMEGLERVALREYMQAVDAEARAQHAWHGLKESIEDVRRQQCKSIMDDSGKWVLYDAHGRWLQTRLVAVEREWRQAATELEQLRESLHLRHVATQTWVHLSDAADLEHRIENAKREQGDMDELALQRYRKAVEDRWQ